MIHIIGGGLAGSEAAWQAASRGVPVTLHEMRPVRPTAVHKTDRLAELVCSNSFRGDKLDNAVGLLKEEMRRLGSLVMRAADAAACPAGAALAVDRERFSARRDAARSRRIRSSRFVREESAAHSRERRRSGDHRDRSADVRRRCRPTSPRWSAPSISTSTTRSARSSWPRRIDMAKVFRASRWGRSLRGRQRSVRAGRARRPTPSSAGVRRGRRRRRLPELPVHRARSTRGSTTR